MIEKIRAIYNRALLRPMIYMATNRFLIALILLLLANLLLSGAHIKMYAALLLGVCRPVSSAHRQHPAGSLSLLQAAPAMPTAWTACACPS